MEAEHFEHVRFWFLSWFYADGEQETPLEKPPSRLYEWPVGPTYSFLIDILDDYRTTRLLNYRVSPAELRSRIRKVDKNVTVYWPYRGSHVNLALTAE